MRLVVLACIAIGALFVWRTGLAMPDVVASHFDASGAANGFMPRASYLRLMIGVIVVVPAALAFGAQGLMRTSAESIHLPNRDYWLAPERRDASLRSVIARLQGFGCLLIGLLCFVHHAVVEANLRTPPALANRGFFIAIVVFVALTLVWLAALHRRFARIP